LQTKGGIKRGREGGIKRGREGSREGGAPSEAIIGGRQAGRQAGRQEGTWMMNALPFVGDDVSSPIYHLSEV